MTIRLYDVSKNAIEDIRKSSLDSVKYGTDERPVCRIDGVKNVHLSEMYLYIEGLNDLLIISSYGYSYFEAM